MSSTNTNTMLAGTTFGLPRQGRSLKAVASQIENSANAAKGTVKASMYYFKRQEGKKEVDGLAPLKTFQSAWKAALKHYARYPFAGDMRILPAGLVQQFMDENGKFTEAKQGVFDQWMNEDYPGWKDSAPARMGTLHDPGLFPSEEDCRNRFVCEVAVVPLSGSEQWQRITLLSPNLAAFMQKNQDETVERATREAHAKLWADVMKPLNNIVTQLSKDKSKIHDSLIGNLIAVTDLIPAYNEIHKDNNLTMLARQVKEQLSTIDPDDLRKDAAARSAAVESAKLICQQFDPYARSFNVDDE